MKPMKNDNRNQKPYTLTDAATGSHVAKWGKDERAVGAPQRHNWIIRRDPLIVVSGDRPASSTWYWIRTDLCGRWLSKF